MTTTFFPSQLNAYPATVPYVAQIPGRLRQGDSAQWIDIPFRDANGTSYDSGTYTLKYTINGPIQSPLVLTATASGSNWQTNLTPVQSAGLLALAPFSTYWWAAQIYGANLRLTIAEGELTLEPDLALQANFDGRTVAEKALAQAEAALSVFQASGGRVQHYTIGNRSMTFQRDAEVLQIVEYWRKRVRSEQSIASGGSDRFILTRFNRAR